MKPTFARRFIAGVLGLVSVVAFTSSAQAAGEVKKPREVYGSWEGPFGRFDRAQLQRGFQVYKEVCSGCHRVIHCLRVIMMS
jgi:cytochrome c1